MATGNDIRNGLTIVMNDDIYTVVDFLHVKPGKGGAFVRTKLKNLLSGKVIDRTFRSEERIETVRVEGKDIEFLYEDNDLYYFMDNETYDQLEFHEEFLGENIIKYLKENTVVKVKFHGDIPLLVELPTFVVLQIIETDPGVRGDTATGGSKPAKLETGAVIQVPLFVQQGSNVRVDTRTGEYVERV